MTALPGSVGRNFLALGGGEAASRLIAFGTTIILARRFGPEGYGVIAFAAGVTLYLTKIAEGALDYVGVAAIAATPGRTTRLGSALLTIRVLVTAALAAVAMLAVHLTLPDPDRGVLLVYLAVLLPVAANPKWILIGLHDARAVGMVRVAGESLALLLVVVLVQSGSELWAAPVAVGAGELLAALTLYQVLRIGGHRLRPTLAREEAAPVFRAALPVVALSLLGLIMYNSGLLFLRILRDHAAVGQYAAAFTLIGFLANIGLALAMALIPGLTHLRATPAEERALYHRAIAICAAAALPVAVAVAILSGPIMLLGFGSGYAGAGTALAILAWSIPLTALRNVPLAALVARGEQRLLLRASAIAAGVNLALNAILIPSFGIPGAAAAAVATESLAGVLTLFYAARQGLGFVPVNRLLRPAAATAAMGGTLLLLRDLPLAVAAAGGGAACLGVLAATGAIRWRPGRLPTLDL